MTAHDLSSRLLVICDRIAAGGRFDADEEAHLLIEAARLLAAQPTDAQKIEALKHASSAGAYGERCREAMTVYLHDFLHPIYDIRGGSPEDIGENAYPAGLHARKALRLLGLPTE